MHIVHLPLVQIDLACIRRTANAIAHRTNTPVIAVIKSDAYGLGAREVVSALHEVVAGFYCFTLREAVDAGTWQSGKPAISLVPDHDETTREYREFHVRPAVWDEARAGLLRAAKPVLTVDTGMQRFGCHRDQIDAIIAAGGCDEAFTHATRIEQARLLSEWCAGRGLRLHAAGSSLLNEPDAQFDYVRPGLAIYRDAVRVTARLIEARDTTGPLGYRGLTPATGRHGVIIGGYAIGLRPGPCLVNGQPRRILECGMQSSYIEIGPGDRVGDEVVLLGDDLGVQDIARVWGTTPHEALLQLTSCGQREYHW